MRLFFSSTATKFPKNTSCLLITILGCSFLELILIFIGGYYLLMLWGVIGDTVSNHPSENIFSYLFFFNLAEHILFIFLFVWQCYLASKSLRAFQIIKKNTRIINQKVSLYRGIDQRKGKGQQGNDGRFEMQSSWTNNSWNGKSFWLYCKYIVHE